MMQRIWAPWRMPYIKSEGEKTEKHDCIFCTLPADPTTYRQHLIFSCGKDVFLIANRYPYTNGHVMVIPRRHVADPSRLTTIEFQRLTELLRRATSAIQHISGAHGMNIGMNLGRAAGAGIDEHCHYHIVPRWNGDTNFMPILGEVKVISEGLDEMYTRLEPVLRDLATDVEKEV